jgi:hypothetical protein
MIKESSQQEEITILNIYTSNIRAGKYVKQILIDVKEEGDSSTIVGDFNLPLSAMDRSRQKVNKETAQLNCTPYQMDFEAIHRN